MTPEVKEAYDNMMDFYDRVMRHIALGMDVGQQSLTVIMFHEKARRYASELMCPARKPACLEVEAPKPAPAKASGYPEYLKRVYSGVLCETL